MLELYSNIKKYRLENKMSQEELAGKTGYTDRSSIAKIERGDVDLPQSKILLFAKALHTSPSVLMGNDGLRDTSNDYSEDESRLLDGYRKLNDSGKQEMHKRLYELSQLPDYSEEKSLRSDAG